MRAEGIALIPRCAECQTHWLPGDDERWAAYLTDDEPPEVIFTVLTALSESSATTSGFAHHSSIASLNRASPLWLG